jgi:hypothetical protein
MFDSHLENLADTILVNLVHRKGLDTILPKDPLLACVNITKTNVDKLFRSEARFDPVELLDLTSNSEKERDGAAVDVATLCGFWSVDILMNVQGRQRGRFRISCAIFIVIHIPMAGLGYS